MTFSQIQAVFARAALDKRAIEIRHTGQDGFVKFIPHAVGTEGASGIMPENSGLWPRSARFSEIAEARAVQS